MSRRRYISTKLSQDSKINKLAMTAGDFAAMLYTWLIPHAEDDARVYGDIEEIMMMVIPGRRDKTPEDVTSALLAMEELGLIIWNQEEHYIEFPPEKFYSYQTYITENRRQCRSTPDPERTSPNNAANQRKSAQNASSFKVSSSSSVSSSVRDMATQAASAAPSRPSPTPKAQKTAEPPAIKARLPDPLWDAMVEAMGQGPATKNERGHWNSALKQLRDIGATPDDIRNRASTYRVEWPKVTLTPMALVNNWTLFAHITSPPSKKAEDMTYDDLQRARDARTAADAALAAERQAKIARINEQYPITFKDGT